MKLKSYSSYCLLGLCLLTAFLFTQPTTSKDFVSSGQTTIKHSLVDLLGKSTATQFQKITDIHKTQQWQVYLPTNELTKPPGLFVYVSPVKTGQITQEWKRVMDKHNLIYIAADAAGNWTKPNHRIVMAINAVPAAMRQWSINKNRIIISGFSGGGRIASMLAIQYPNIFSSALYICGVNYWEESWQPDMDKLTSHRFVFFTGTNDFNLGQTRDIHTRYLKAGLKNSKLLVANRTAHELPNANYLNLALSYLLINN